MSDAARDPRLELAPQWRYRCFGQSTDRKFPCIRPATRRAADPRRADALTFWCDVCAPAIATPIEVNQPYLEFGIAGLIVIAGTTIQHEHAGLEALMAVEVAVGQLGGAFRVADMKTMLKTPVPIVGARRG